MSNPRSRSVRWLVGAGLATIVVMAVGTGLATAKSSDKNLQLHATQTSEIQLPLGPADSPVGSESVGSWRLDQHGTPAGSLSTVCQVVDSSDQSSKAQCVATATLAKGQLTVQGLVTISDAVGDFDLAITGGTGSYRGARGIAHVHPLDPTNQQVEFTVTG